MPDNIREIKGLNLPIGKGKSFVPKQYVPHAGDIVWLEFDPSAGRAQAGQWPALVQSPASYSDKVNLTDQCPLSRKQKDIPL